jgi:integrase
LESAQQQAAPGASSSTKELDQSDPWELYIYAIKAPATKSKYCQRLRAYLEFLGYTQDSIEDKARAFAAKARTDSNYAFSSLLRFFQMQRERIERKEITVGTVRNYAKAIKLFYEMSDLTVAWQKIMRGLPRGRRYADDRAPTLEEIRRITDYPDRRIKPIVYMMASSGIRVGAWDYLKWGHITPIERKGKLVAAKVMVYAGSEDAYFAYITPEAYRELAAWMKYRADCGEKVTSTSWVMRDLWDTVAAIRKYTHTTGLVTMPQKLSSIGIKRLIERALWAQGLRKELEEGKKRHEFATCHALRKFFKTRCELAGVKPINVENLMGHSTGISDAYYRPSEQDLLEDYLKATDSLSVDDARKLRIEIESLNAEFSELSQKDRRIDEN